MGEKENKYERAGADVARGTIWVFPCSGFGSEAVFPPPSSSLSSTTPRLHALFIVAFINNLIEKAKEESHQNIIEPNGTDRVP